MALAAFWSYVHFDDDTDGGRIRQLAEDISANYGSVTGDEIEIFVDRDAIRWGEAWESRVDETLSSVAYFIPVVTPRFFQSAECRRELTVFAERATRLGITEIIMPILYIDVPELTDSPTDTAMQTIVRYQWTDWRDLRFEDRSSGAYRRAVHDLASELARRVRDTEIVDPPDALDSPESDGDADEDAAGFIDRVVAMEEALPRIQLSLVAIAAKIEEIGQLMNSATERMKAGDAKGQGFAARLTVARQVAHDVLAPVEAIETYATGYTASVKEIDAGMIVLLEHAVASFDSGDSEDRESIQEFLESVRDASESARTALGSVEEMARSAGDLGGLSRDLRKPMRRLRSALNELVDSRTITDRWGERVDESGLISV